MLCGVAWAALTTDISLGGMLARQTKGSAVTKYIVDATGGLPEWLGANDVSGTTWYIRGFGREISRERNNALTWYAADRLGSVRAEDTTPSSANRKVNYEPFGAVEGSTQPFDYGFTGEPHDGTLKLVHLRARWYAPGSDRFLTTDPFPGVLGRPQSLHRYSYAENNPVAWIDPSGQCIEASPSAWGDRQATDPGGRNLYQLACRPVQCIVPPCPCIRDEPAPPPTPTPPAPTPTPLPAPAPGAPPETEPAPTTPTPRPAVPNIPPPGQEFHLYHYTPEENIPAIISGGLRPSLRDPDNPKSDAQWGDGHYFTDISPEEASRYSMFQLSRALFAIPWHWGTKTRYDIGWLRIDVSGLPLQRVPVFSRSYGDRSIYLHPTRTTLPVSQRLRGTGTVEFQPTPQDLR